jgi:hypothetical protein
MRFEDLMAHLAYFSSLLLNISFGRLKAKIRSLISSKAQVLLTVERFSVVFRLPLYLQLT